jgi:uncharacterized 2Fe-2S/4Fe-4S cluster protein (DUF4445 family)
MGEQIKIELQPLGQTIAARHGAALRDLLFAYGVEFPCGGHGTCGRCRIRVLSGELGVSAADEDVLSADEIAAGWRLACHARAEVDATLEIEQMEASILGDDRAFRFEPREGTGIAFDLGTTTLVGQLLDLRTAHVLGVRSALNPQVAWGSDVMSRVELALTTEGRAMLRESIRETLGRLSAELLEDSRGKGGAVQRVVISGNTVMHHLFCNLDVEPLSHFPFETPTGGLRSYRAGELGWKLRGDPEVHFLPCLGGFVGSDVLAGIVATGIWRSDQLVALVDLGTNGEIVVGNRHGLLCASTAAGPAFEGGRISCGLRAVTGAITEVGLKNGALECRVMGEGTARGICGSGLVDAVAAGLELGWVGASGRFANGSKTLPLRDGLELTQRDIRELQLAKGAIAAGIEILLDQIGATAGDLNRLYLAGAFGNYVNRTSARRIGLLTYPEHIVEPEGNTSLLGTKLALFREEDLEYREIRGMTRHLSLSEHPRFQDMYVDRMRFPEPVVS